MTFWNAYILAIIVIYLAAFFIRNLRTYFHVKTSIRGSSTKLTISLILSTIIYLIAFLNLFYSSLVKALIPIHFLLIPFIQYVGYGLIFLALITGLTALFEMQDSWRVGIKYDQKTALVTTGIYSISRNPYFLSYDLLFLGLFLIFPSVLIFFLIIGLAITFHLMIREEESYLEIMHGETYSKYKTAVGRYLVFF